MKLSARKSMVAMGTALSLSMAPIVAPSMAPSAFAVTVSDSQYRGKYDNADTRIDSLERQIKQFDEKIAAEKNEDGNLLQAKNDLLSARNALDNAKGDFGTLTKDGNDENTRKVLGGVLDNLADAERYFNDAKGDFNKVFRCDLEGNSNSDEDGSSVDSLSSGFLGLFGSSGNKVVVNNGKKTCVPKTQALVDKLSSFAKILGVVLSVITAVAALNNAVQKNNPLMPKK